MGLCFADEGKGQKLERTGIFFLGVIWFFVVVLGKTSEQVEQDERESELRKIKDKVHQQEGANAIQSTVGK